jgi:hypothetical protein
MLKLVEGVQLNDWVLGKRLGAGSCSEVYEGNIVKWIYLRNLLAFMRDPTTELPFAIKISPLPIVPRAKSKFNRKKTNQERHADALYSEYMVYCALRGHEGISEVPLNAYGEAIVGESNGICADTDTP